MKTPTDMGMTFLIITNEYWCKNDIFKEAKKEAARNGNFPKGSKRTYRGFLVQKDTTVTMDGSLEFNSSLAAETALYLGEV